MKFMLALAALLVLAATAHGRNINAEGLKLIKTFEGFRANFYGDVTVSHPENCCRCLLLF